MLLVPEVLTHLAGEGADAARWKAVLAEAQQCEVLGHGKKALRKLTIAVFGGHSAYHDMKARSRIELTCQVWLTQQCDKPALTYTFEGAFTCGHGVLAHFDHDSKAMSCYKRVLSDSFVTTEQQYVKRE